jgi:hypothetical protein
MNRLHLAVGLTTVAIFLYTGVYMQTGFPDLYLADEAIRYQYRANHIYLLLAGLLNIVMGIYLARQANPWRRFLQHLGSVALLLGPLLLIYAFFYEAPLGTPERVVTFFGVVCLLAGTLCHLLQPLLKGSRVAVALPEGGELRETRLPSAK